MKLVRYSRKHEPPTLARAGVLVGQDLIADLRAGYALYLVEEAGHAKGRELAAIYLPPYLAQFLHAGEPAWLALADAYSYLAGLAQTAPDTAGLSGEQLFIPAAECRLYAPVRPSKLIAVARNYPAGTRNGPPGRVPAGFVKTQSSLIGSGRDIVKPAGVQDLDCETELAVVIGKKCKHVREEDAYGVVAGYTIVNDVTARDVGKLEREGGQLFLAKTYDTFCAMGPWLMTREAIPDPMRLAIRTRVNGESRRAGNTKDMIWPIPKLISYFSQITLMPGDVIATGAPGGGALANPVWSLQAGDVIESEVEGIGVLTNAVVDEPRVTA
jgi:2-keto-4-pentenoate hydratase/2-oxohepta-3-ene-1,7-dioic acid hydratase in catechol pathway